MAQRTAPSPIYLDDPSSSSSRSHHTPYHPGLPYDGHLEAGLSVAAASGLDPNSAASAQARARSVSPTKTMNGRADRHQHDKDRDRPPNSPTTPHKQFSFSISSAGPNRVGLVGIAAMFGGRIVRGARRGNVPFLLVFIGCLWIFFSALAGIGYSDPDAASLAAELPDAEFVPGAPVYDSTEDQIELQRQRVMDEQRELEQQWRKMKRPQDGAWMQGGRDDKAVRRQPLQADRPPPIQITEETEEEHQGLRKRDLPNELEGLEKLD